MINTVPKPKGPFDQIVDSVNTTLPSRTIIDNISQDLDDSSHTTVPDLRHFFYLKNLLDNQLQMCHKILQKMYKILSYPESPLKLKAFFSRQSL